MRLVNILLLFLITGLKAFSQNSIYEKDLKVERLQDYMQDVKQHLDARLVEIIPAKTGIQLDIRYATSNNFMGRPMYSQARAFVRVPVYNALLSIQKDLKKQGLGLKVFDGYRPYSVTIKFYEMARDTSFVADPRKGSRDNLGAAVDLTLVDLANGKELEMPTGYDSFTNAAAADYPNVSPIAARNRALLQKEMLTQGFQILPSEWWHFDFMNRKSFELLDIPFEKL